MRVFVAIEISDEVRVALGDCIEGLRGHGGGTVKWVRPENIHLTLHFLGEQPGARVAEVSALLDEAACAVPPFRLRVAGLGRFGSRVVWAGIEPVPGPLAALHAGLAEALGAADFPVEDRPFHPHLTLGRIRRGRMPRGLTSKIVSSNNTALGVAPIQDVLLVQSDLSADGAHYSAVHRAPLTGSD